MKISVITPTANRREMLKRCIEMYQKQDWQGEKQLIIIHDSSDGDNIGFWQGIDNVLHLTMNGTIGHKRNYGVSNAAGEIIIHMDSDDIYPPDYITHSVNALVNSGAALVGLNKFYFYNQNNSRAYEYHYQGGQKNISGATMCYWRKTWEANPFPDISQGEDAVFCSTIRYISYGDYQDSFCAIRHGVNTSPVNFNGKEFTEIPKLPDNLLAHI